MRTNRKPPAPEGDDFFPANPIKTQSKVTQTLQPELRANVHGLIRRWETNKQTSRRHGLDFPNQFGLVLLLLEQEPADFHTHAFGCVPA